MLIFIGAKRAGKVRVQNETWRLKLLVCHLKERSLLDKWLFETSRLRDQKNKGCTCTRCARYFGAIAYFVRCNKYLYIYVEMIVHLVSMQSSLSTSSLKSIFVNVKILIQSYKIVSIYAFMNIILEQRYLEIIVPFYLTKISTTFTFRKFWSEDT